MSKAHMTRVPPLPPSRTGKFVQTFPCKEFFAAYLRIMTDPQPDSQPGAHSYYLREFGISALKGLASPLRMAIDYALAKYGAQTATTLAGRLGESTGSTSITCVSSLGMTSSGRSRVASAGREKWWE